MPANQLLALHKSTRVPLAKLEEYWEAAKLQADKKFGERDSHYWAYVSRITSNRAKSRKTK
jgi:hypothetical protein